MGRKARFSQAPDDDETDLFQDEATVVAEDCQQNLADVALAAVDLQADKELELDDTFPTLHGAAVALNRASMEHLKRGENDKASEKLTRAQEILAQAERSCPSEEANKLSSTRAAIASSIAICHKRDGNYPMAVRSLETAIELYEAARADMRELMAAQLNLSACFSEAEMPEEALQHAMAAVALGGQFIAQGAHQQPGAQVEEEGSLIRPDDYAMLAVAYHKTAEAHEHMKQWSQATLAYTQAYEVVRRSLGPQHQLTKSFEKSARCPRRPAPPEVPLSWRAASGSGRMPMLPDVGRPPSSRTKSRATELRGTIREPLGYSLSPKSFPSWPPKKASSEERAWYQMAISESKQKKSAVATQIRDQKWTSKIYSGQASMDLDPSGHRNMAAIGGHVIG